MTAQTEFYENDSLREKRTVSEVCIEEDLRKSRCEQTEQFLQLSDEILKILLKDKTTGRNIIWACDDYTEFGKKFAFEKPILLSLLTFEGRQTIRPRIEKSRIERRQRTKGKAEVFTPAWVCNEMLCAVDEAWFGGEPFGKFCEIREKSWTANPEKILFPPEKTWRDYVSQNRLEIACGEAPFLASRYDAATGRAIPVRERCGILDRKLRVVSENADGEKEWLLWAENAAKSCYGYDWQGDNVFLARQNLLMDFDEHFFAKFGFRLPDGAAKSFAKIIAWNVWQMDGLKFVVPQTCKNETKIIPATLFEEEKILKTECPACKARFDLKKMRGHDGIFCRIMDWSENKAVFAVDLLKTAGENLAVHGLF